MKYIHLLIVFAICSLVGCQSAPATTDEINEAVTQTVLDHHWETFVSNDLEGVMKDYTDESVLITPDATYSGLEEIRQNFINAFKAFQTGNSKLTLNHSKVVKDVGYILWEADTPQMTLNYATDSFIIRKGKIIRQTYAGVAVPK